jgi:hypothetical protein
VLAYVPVAAGADAGQTASQLAEALEGIAAAPGAGVAQARSLVTALGAGIERTCGPAAYEQGVRSLSGRMGEEQAERFALGNIALQLGLMAHAFGPDPEARLAELLAKDAAWWEGVVRRTINPGQRRITLLVPGGD